MMKKPQLNFTYAILMKVKSFNTYESEIVDNICREIEKTIGCAKIRCTDYIEHL